MFMMRDIYAIDAPSWLAASLLVYEMSNSFLD